jgi:hypothetical protein
MKKKFNWVRAGRFVLMFTALVAVIWNLVCLIIGKYGVSEFAEILVAIGTGLLAYATWELGQTTISENKIIRKDNARLRIQEWASNNIKLLELPSFRQSLSDKLTMNEAIQIMIVNSLSVKGDAILLGEDVEESIKKAIEAILTFKEAADAFDNAATTIKLQADSEFEKNMPSFIDKITMSLTDVLQVMG